MIHTIYKRLRLRKSSLRIKKLEELGIILTAATLVISETTQKNALNQSIAENNKNLDQLRKAQSTKKEEYTPFNTTFIRLATTIIQTATNLLHPAKPQVQPQEAQNQPLPKAITLLAEATKESRIVDELCTTLSAYLEVAILSSHT